MCEIKMINIQNERTKNKNENGKKNKIKRIKIYQGRYRLD